MLAALLLMLQAATATQPDPFAFFGSDAPLDAGDRRHLEEGTPIAHVLPARGREVAVFAAVPVWIDSDRLIAWMRRIEQLKASRYVVAIGRFSDPPRLEDLAGLSLDDDELAAVRECRRGDCGLKLAAAEMAELQGAAARAGPDWKPAVQQAFRRVVLQRVQAYLSRGQTALPPYEDDDEPVRPEAVFAALMQQSAFLAAGVPRFAEYLGRYPQAPMECVESFVYWSKERIANKPIVSATHVSILRARGHLQPDVLVAGRQILATHYLNGSLGITAILPGRPGMPNYLFYLNRSELDVLSGPFKGLVRWFMQRRLKSEASDVLRELRQRLEGGLPVGSSVRAISSSPK